MKHVFLASLAKFTTSLIVVSAILFTLVPGGQSTVHASPSAAQDNCGQLLADAKAAFMATLAPDGSVPETPENRAAALEYIRVSKLCYEEVTSQDSSATLQADSPSYIDDGGLVLGGTASAEFVLDGRKWGASAQGTSAGTVTYSFMGSGINFGFNEDPKKDYGDSVAITRLPGFQLCFLTEIRNAFSAWQAVSNIKFVEVPDSNTAFDSAGATGDIRIAAHYFDGASGILAHAYYPPPNGTSAAGDLHFDSSENWTCNTSGVDIGVVAMHEIGHSIGLAHEGTSTIALMDPYYNSSLTAPQSDDINGITSIYGGPVNLAAPLNDNFIAAKSVTLGTTDTISDVAGATVEAGEPSVKVSCDTKMLKLGTNTVWYTYKPTVSGIQSMDTYGSNYDTYIALWTGSSITGLTLLGCDDDDQGGYTSQLSANLTKDVTYYIQVAKYDGVVGGSSDPACGTTSYPTCKLVFNIKAQTFADVPPTHPYFQYIEALYANHFTAGCAQAPLRYCPSNYMNRGEAAVFVIRGNFGAGFLPPPPTHMFKDDWRLVPWAESWAEAMKNNNISAGCLTSPLKYCPLNLLPREQWVIFGVRLKYGGGYVPPAASGTLFADMTDTSSLYIAWAEQAYKDELIPACGIASNGKPMFCPKASVDRGLAAYVVTKAKGLVP
jgi:hypothetical protein